MTIHTDHPFLPSEPERDPVRRLRGRLPDAVTVWTAVSDGRAVGLTVASALVVLGDPGSVLGAIDPESDLYAAAQASGRFAVSLLRWSDRHLADVLGGVAPAPDGSVFGDVRWRSTPGGLVLGDRSWLSCRVTDTREVGWSVVVTGAIDEAFVAPDDDAAEALLSVRGRYRVPRKPG